jgi:hypothetical protein
MMFDEAEQGSRRGWQGNRLKRDAIPKDQNV